MWQLRIRAALLAFTVLSFAWFDGPAEAAGAPVSFKVGIAAPTVNMLPLWMGQAAGLFQARGLAIEIVNTDGGSRGLSEVGEGRLQAMVVGLSAVIDANGKGGDYRIIASGANTMSFRFFGAKGVTRADFLVGKQVGVSAFGSESDSAASLALRQLGLARRQVKTVEAGGTLKRLNALRSGALAATALNEPADTLAQRAGLPLLVDLKANLPWIFTAIVMDRRTLMARRGVVKDFLRAYVEAIDLALSDPARAKAVLASEFKDFPPDVVDATYADFRARVPRDAAPSREGAQTMLRELPGLGAVVKSTNVADYIDSSLIEELRSEGFFDAMKSKYRVE
jgi:ABC-type nitrate/sulfonate/bicarbonate transport system substrate-binding protein